MITGFSGRNGSDIDVTYARDERLGLWLPASMKDRHETDVVEAGRTAYGATDPSSRMTVVVGTATYGDFKRFETSATVKIKNGRPRGVQATLVARRAVGRAVSGRTTGTSSTNLPQRRRLLTIETSVRDKSGLAVPDSADVGVHRHHRRQTAPGRVRAVLQD